MPSDRITPVKEVFLLDIGELNLVLGQRLLHQLSGADPAQQQFVLHRLRSANRRTAQQRTLPLFFQVATRLI